MLRLLLDTGFLPDNASTVIRCMGHAASGRALFLGDLDFYESQFGTISDELASFLLSKHGHADNEERLALFHRLLNRAALPTPGAAFTFGDTVLQNETAHAIKAVLAGFEANAVYWTAGFPADWDA